MRLLNQNPTEFTRLLDIYVEHQPRRVLEIGTYEGGSLFYWITTAPDNAIVGTIDNQHINRSEYSGWNTNIDVRVYDGKSQHPDAILFAMEFSPLDFLFIDGGHSYGEVFYDWYHYGVSLVKPGGIIALHDIDKTEPYIGNDGATIYPVEVHRLWKEIKQDYKTIEIVEPHSEWGRGPGIGVVFK